MTKGILYYSHNTIDGTKLNNACRESLAVGLPITSVTHKPINFGNNIIFDQSKVFNPMIEQIILGLESMTEDYVYLVEHDCLYHSSHFNSYFDSITYNINVWRLTPLGYHKCCSEAPVLSACSGPRRLLLEAMKDKLAICKQFKEIIYEPGRDDDIDFKTYISKIPCIDVRHNKNTTSGWSKCHTHIKMLPYWGDALELRKKLNI